MMRCIATIGFGKECIGQVLPEIRKSIPEDVTMLFCVPPSSEWKDRRENGELEVKVRDYHGQEYYKSSCIYKNKEETMEEFVHRCETSKTHNGIVILESDKTMQEVAMLSNILITCVGINALSSVIEKIMRIDRGFHKCIFAFENQPEAVMKIAARYHMAEQGIELIHCPIDRVVVDRHFSSDGRRVIVDLGMDNSSMIMVHDKYGVFSSIVKPDRNSALIVTNKSTAIKETLIKKNGCKNVVHKLSCNYFLQQNKHNDIESIRHRSLCDLISSTGTDVMTYMQEKKPAIVIETLASMIISSGNCNNAYITNTYKELVSYYDNALYTVVNDTSDSIGRIIHLETTDSMMADRRILINTLSSYKKNMNNTMLGDFYAYLEHHMKILKDDVLLVFDSIITLLE